MTDLMHAPATDLPLLPTEAHAMSLVLEWQRQHLDFGLGLARYGNPALALRRFGLARWEMGEQGLAAEAFRAALSLTPANAFLWADLAGVMNAEMHVAGALACLERSLSLDAAQPAVWLSCATLRQGRGEVAQAERAFRNALALDAGLAAAHFGLGILCFSQRDTAAAVGHLREAIACGADDAMAFTSYAHVSFLVGNFDEAATAFARAAERGPLDPHSRRRSLRSLLLRSMRSDDVETSLAIYAGVAGDTAEEPVTLVREAFSILSGFGHHAAATAAGVWLLARAPNDPVQQYLVDALQGAKLSRAPDAYLERHFDAFAPTFDRQLVEVLRYDVPAKLADALQRHRNRFGTMLDLGCGTGLAAAHLGRFGARVEGVDISGAMLTLAAERAFYTALTRSEAVAFLSARLQPFDCIFVADVLVYVGDLENFVAAATHALEPGGSLAVSVETTDADDFLLLPSGRFAHAPSYVRRLLHAAFDIVEQEAIVIRLEASLPVAGLLLIAKRRFPDRPTATHATQTKGAAP